MITLNRYLPYLAGIGVALAWGFSFMFTSDTLDHIAPFHLLGLRYGTAVAAMAVLRAARIISFNVRLADYIKLLPLTLFLPLLYFPAETYGIMYTSSSYSGMIVATIPIFVAIFAIIFIREYPTKVQALFIAASVIGVIFIIFMDTQSITGVSPLGILFLLVAVIGAAGYNILSRIASSSYSPVRTTWVMMVVGAVVFNTIAIIQHANAGQISMYLQPLPEHWRAVTYLGVFSSVTAFFLYNFVLSKVTATQGSIFANMVTVIAIAAGVIFLNEAVYWYYLIGTALILAGVWGTNRFAQQELEDNKEYRQATQHSS